ncbi:unnamed protein product [Nippostrongylus brasiliensis]|uniref:G_PROTEIN_RECEP_F1_2 domain-containing protein n=1 Tax=Nippostrongylus brasiliensis TaxID=27835 RepID=A0A158QYL5_NIPBR|nr:unnamed protein product [Nippostrongylus brasiliensis]
MEEEFPANETGLNDGEGLPVLPFLPPTEEPSSVTLAISVALVGCLTIAICGNASQIVLQIYTRRLSRKIPAQAFIAILLFINFLLPLGLPSVILEKLVRIWMFGRVSCHAHHMLTTAGRVVIPWTITVLHAFSAMFLTRPNRLTRMEGMLASAAFCGLLVLVLAIVIPQGMAAELELIRKDEIDSEQYIMLIHTYRCFLKPELYPVRRTAKFAFEFAVPLLIALYFHLQIGSSSKLASRRAVSKNLICIVIIHYMCNVLYYAPDEHRKLLFAMLPDDADPQQLLPFLSPTLIWYPLSQLSAALSRCNMDKIEDDRSRSRVTGGRGNDIERSHLMKHNLDS